LAPIGGSWLGLGLVRLLAKPEETVQSEQLADAA
jgi:hypothetical protein